MKKFFKIRVKKRKELLSKVIDRIQTNGKISFEGSFKGKIQLKVIPSLNEIGELKRNTLFPKQELWIYDINDQTKEYLKKDILNSIGLRENVIHIFIEEDAQVIFRSYDNFDAEGVALAETNSIDMEFIQSLKLDGIIWDYQIAISD